MSFDMALNDLYRSSAISFNDVIEKSTIGSTIGSTEKSWLLQLLEAQDYESILWLISDCDFKIDEKFVADVVNDHTFMLNFLKSFDADGAFVQQIMKRCSEYMTPMDKIKLSTKMKYKDYCSIIGNHFILSDKDKQDLLRACKFHFLNEIEFHFSNDVQLNLGFHNLAKIQSKAIPHVILTLGKFLPMDVIEFEIVSKLKTLMFDTAYNGTTYNGTAYNGTAYNQSTILKNVDGWYCVSPIRCHWEYTIERPFFSNRLDPIMIQANFLPILNTSHSIDQIISITPSNHVNPKKKSKVSKRLYPKIKNNKLAKQRFNKTKSYR